MERRNFKPRISITARLLIVFVSLTIFPARPGLGHPQDPAAAPVPLLKKDHPVDWWFVFKFNTAVFPGCSGGAARACPFGGTVKKYKGGQQFIYASNEDQSLQQGSDCAGDATDDPIGATFEEVYDNSYFYVVWNDQFYNDPKIKGCSKECGAPWAHSKGMVAWNDSGDGFVMQVSTPSWPASGSSKSPRQTDGNTLGCVKNNNIKFSQHFFALKLSKDDLLKVLNALRNASIVTDVANPQLVNNGGPADVQAVVKQLGNKTDGTTFSRDDLSSGVQLISKPSNLHVPPWQMVSAILGGVSLRTATWWSKSKIYTTTPSTPISCWDASLGSPGRVEIATTGRFGGEVFGLTGGSNHAKLAVSSSGEHHYSMFGDMNQEGAISGKKCAGSQNGRGGLFFVIDDSTLFNGLKDLIAGGTAPSK